MSSGWSDENPEQWRRVGLADLPFAVMGRRFVIRGSLDRASLQGRSTHGGWRALGSGSCLAASASSRVLQAADIGRLRALLGRHEPFVHRLGDHQVRIAILGLVERGTLELLEMAGDTFESPRQASEASTDASAPASGRPLPAAAFIPATPTPPRGRPSPAVRPAPEPAAPEPDPIQAVDQDAQAAVLVAASRSGAPFCEQCARRAARSPEPVPA